MQMLLGLLVALVVATAKADDNLTRDSQDLKTLLAEVRQRLPDGWRAEITPDVPAEALRAGRRGEAPCLAVWREREALARYPVANVAGGRSRNPDAEFSLLPVRLRLTILPYLTPDEYRNAAQDNDGRQKRREEFEQQLLKAGVPYGFMGASPVPPSAFRARSAAESEQVRQYAILWSQTEPRPLPSHSYRGLGLEADFDEMLYLQDADARTERETVIERIGALLTAY